MRPNSGRSSWWVCERSHEWSARVAERSRGTGCPFCSGAQAIAGETDFATISPAAAVQWHPTMNGDTKPTDVSAYSHKKYVFLCDLGHQFEATLAKRSSGSGCSYCSGSRVLTGFNDLPSTHPHLVPEWHPTRNAGLDLSSLSAHSHKVAHWTCQLGHDWTATLDGRASGRGCPICAGKETLIGFNTLADLNPDVARSWHPTKNGDRVATDVTAKSGAKIWWICSEEHDWEARVAERTAGQGCPFCAGKRVWPGWNDLQTLRPDVASSWDRDANGNLTPSDVTVSSNKRIWWRCTTVATHVWPARVAKRTMGHGCKECSLAHSSKIEREFLHHMGEILANVAGGTRLHVASGFYASCTVDIEGQWRDEPVVVEYDGSYYHASKTSRDVEKTRALLDSGYIVIRIREDDLPELPIDDNRLFQLNHHYTLGTPEAIQKSVKVTSNLIQDWLESYSIESPQPGDVHE